MPHRYLWSDIWLLQAIIVVDKGDGAGLCGIIHAGTGSTIRSSTMRSSKAALQG